MDMNHDFRPDPETRDAKRPVSRGWTPELFVIIGIFLAVWTAFAVHFLAA